MTTSEQKIGESACGQVTDYLQSHKKALVDEWCANVQKEFGIACESMSKPEIVDHVPNTFDAIIEALRQYNGGTTIEDVRNVAARHTIVRWSQNYNLGAVLQEISLLRSSFVHYLCAFEDEHEHADANARLFAGTTVPIILDNIVADAMKLFLKVREHAHDVSAR